ncbi:ABC transporter permease [Arcanobacterium haemolyticum]|uniref:ABC-2 type transporter n=1 Tax=Arcanobacterium haemolyticum (strain ATCC 9345 / DSM 20595 / CCM 5947 / CCUG 17215 / LMG 16163 / NBRC 15585 / NCTC 8452 / 11018) TaxID=644284 RepID=D7BKV9_ARCHD|nr:hypothetical protein [Arcanobacterium haemolyticum]ADH93289.1 ABC-2 type transporter [Arcanobacterium haemolyticum DSM 20595]QCX47320.1 ABC transporter permease [Arcanobacterium haemolyticum]SQH27878.1 ABC transporter efflux protein, DrrB family [Arcanobacterium haemolyticum]
MSFTLIKMDTLRYLRAPDSIFFTIALPIIMYILFGGTAEYGSIPIGHATINSVVLINMSVYAAAVAAVGYTGTAAVERLQGWGRQLALTPLTNRKIIANRVIASLLIATITLIALHGVGKIMNADMPLLRLGATFALTYLGVAMFALYGITIAHVFRAENAVGIAAGLLVMFAFAGNLFTPLSGGFLTFSRFTPMWGLGELARYPITEGVFYDSHGTLFSTPLWYALINVAAWLIFFAITALLSVRRGQER